MKGTQWTGGDPGGVWEGCRGRSLSAMTLASGDTAVPNALVAKQRKRPWSRAANVALMTKVPDPGTTETPPCSSGTKG